MLNVYAADWCPHCRAAIAFLKKNGIPFRVIDMDSADPETVACIVKVNGGDDWVVPTLEYNGKWCPGEIFNEVKFADDLRKIGIELKC